ncbi:serine/threonine-protein kinase PITSLRE [Cololabis saira]|uniref:serine/threonine-protein kinase PITSLRE n=1 Tax=Cololabis saira TaxID=129043 RepID=UPI002AD20158|nr:serine/threonine-protein kinase PITSLRE [Cololabis saira]
METLGDFRRAGQDMKRGSRGLCLPRLCSNNRHWGDAEAEAALSSGFLSPRSPCRPVPPTQRRSTKGLAAASSHPHDLLSVPSQFCQSALSIMQPLPCSNNRLLNRNHIQTRKGPQKDRNGKKGILPALHSPTSKLLAPLHGQPRGSTALPLLKQHPPLRPIVESPLWTRTPLRRERLSCGSSGPTKPSSEDSGSNSSGSTHSSISLEDEINGRDVHYTAHEDRNLKFFWDDHLQHSRDGKTFQVQPRTDHVSLVHKSKYNREEGLINHTHHLPHTEKAKRFYCEETYRSYIKESADNEPSRPFDYDQKGDAITPEHFLNDKTPAPSVFSADNNDTGCATQSDTEISHGNVFDINDVSGCAALRPERDYRSRLQHVKETQTTENVCCVNKTKGNKPTDCSTTDVKLSTGTAVRKNTVAPKRDKKMFNALKPAVSTVRRTGMDCEPKANNQTCQSFRTTDWNKFKSKQTYSPAPSKKDCDIPQNNQDKLNSRTQQHAPNVELKRTQPLTKPCLNNKTMISKSAVDFISYKDMFQQMQSGDEGPAIYEMFAGPVFENLRVSRSSEHVKVRQMESGPTKKVKQRLLKTVQNKLRGNPDETAAVSGKSKVKPAPSRVKLPPTEVPKKAIDGTGSRKIGAESVPGKDVEATNDCVEKKRDDHVSSTIEETPSNYGVETLKSNYKTLISQKTASRSENDVHKHEITVNTSVGNSPEQVPEPASPSSPTQPQINTLSSSSCHSIQQFADEAGVGPSTEDLLQCLADELISLDEKDVSIRSENPEQSKKEFSREEEPRSGQNIFIEVSPIDSRALLGSELALTWTKGEVLGRGAYGTVHCGLTSQGQLIAVKQVSLDSSDPDVAKKEYYRLQGEVELLKTLEHINIVSFLGTSLYQHAVSIFMEYIPGGSIASIIHRFGPLPEKVLALYTHQILEGVAYLHLNRVIHRDLKGNNVMLMPNGVIKLIDFGCARRLSCLNYTVCNSGELLKSVHGTPYWMAPEVISKSGYGMKSDIWSVGCTVFEMATGKPPLAHMDKMAALFYIGAQRGVMPSLPAGFSESAKDFVNICLTSDQRLRPPADRLLKHSFFPKNDTNRDSLEKQRKKCCGQHVYSKIDVLEFRTSSDQV